MRPLFANLNGKGEEVGGVFVGDGDRAGAFETLTVLGAAEFELEEVEEVGQLWCTNTTAIPVGLAFSGLSGLIFRVLAGLDCGRAGRVDGW